MPKTKQDFEEGIFKETGILMKSCDSYGKLLMGIQVTKPLPLKKPSKKDPKPRTFRKEDSLKLMILAKYIGTKVETLLLIEKEKVTLQKIY